MTKYKAEYLYIPLKDDDYKLRFSTGKIGYLDGGVSIASRYLRPSMGSCHDFCKYGEGHALEIKARAPIPMSKRIMATQGAGPELEKIVTSAEKAKRLAINIKPSPGSRNQKLDDPLVKEDVSSDVLVREVSSLVKEEAILSNQSSTPVKEIDDFVEHAIDPINKEAHAIDPINKEAHAIDPINKEVHCIDPINNEVHAIDPINNEVHAIDPINNEVHAIDPINNEVSSLTNTEAMSKSIMATQGAGLEMENILTSSDRAESLAVNIKPSPGSHTQKPDELVVKEEVSSDVLVREVLSLSKKEAISSKQVSTPPREVDVFMKKQGNPKLKKPVKSNLSSVAMQRCSNNEGDRKIRRNKQVGYLPVNSTGAQRKVLVRPAVSLSTKYSAKRPSSRNGGKSNNLNGVSQLSNPKTFRKHKHERASSRDVPEKTLPAVELNSVRKTLRPVKTGSCATRGLKLANHGIHSAELPTFYAKRNLRRAQAKGHTAQSPRSWSSSLQNKNVRSIRLDTHVTGSSTLSSLASSSGKSGASSEHSNMETENGILQLKKENNSRSRKAGTISLKDKRDPGQKLTFRRGTVVELQQEDNTPRRLKFKKRFPGGNHNIEGDASRVWAIVKKEGDASRVLTIAKKEADSKEVSVTKSESKIVVLRHPDVKRETNSSSLYNNVIEETVSKLVKTRASKVKALVGAFESLIPLQDTKTLETAAAS